MSVKEETIIKIVACIILVRNILIFLGSFAVFNVLKNAGSHTEASWSIFRIIFFLFPIIFSMIQIIASVGVVLLKNWGRILAIPVVAILFITNLYGLLGAFVNIKILFICLPLAVFYSFVWFYLSREQTKSLFT